MTLIKPTIIYKENEPQQILIQSVAGGRADLCIIFCDSVIRFNRGEIYPAELKEIMLIADNFHLFYGILKRIT